MLLNSIDYKWAGFCWFLLGNSVIFLQKRISFFPTKLCGNFQEWFVDYVQIYKGLYKRKIRYNWDECYVPQFNNFVV